MSELRYMFAISLLLVAIAAAPVEAQADQRRIAEGLVSEDRAEKIAALREARAIGPEAAGQELRAALIAALRRENEIRRVRQELLSRGESVEPVPDDFHGSVTELVVALRAPEAIPALAGTLGTGLLVIRAIAAFGDPAASAVLDIVNSPRSASNQVGDGLIALRFMIEAPVGPRLSPRTVEEVRSAVHRRLTGEQSVTTLRRALDLAAILGDDDLMQIVESLARDGEEIAARGIDDAELIDRTRRHAAERLAGVPALPRPEGGG